MNFFPLPTAVITDADVAGGLGRVVRIINPLLDVLWGSDPLGLKRRTHHLDASEGTIDKAVDAMAWALNVVDVPGTQAWAEMDVEARINWWVWRVGAVDTIAVAFPGALGAVGDRLPIQDLLGFASQAVVLCAVARELGVTEHRQQVRLLAAVLCHRDLTDEPEDGGPDDPESLTPSGLPDTLMHLVGVFRGVGAELDRRPQPMRIFRYLGMLPVVGAVVDYVGEFGALLRTAKAGQRWIAAHPR